MSKKAYIAGPFFNPEQVAHIEDLERTVRMSGLEFYSPMRDGRIIDMTTEQRMAASREIFRRNMTKLFEADVVIAMTDDFDAGTMFEIGVIAGAEWTVDLQVLHNFKEVLEVYERTPILTYSPGGYGLNVMIAEAIQGHYTDLDRLGKSLESWRFSGKAEVTT